MIKAIRIYLHFPQDENSIDVTHLYKYGSAHISERLCNEEKKSVQDVISFSINHDNDIINKLREANDTIKIVVQDLTDDSFIFSGIIEPTTSQTVNQIVEAIQLEAIDSTWKFDKDIDVTIQFPAGIGSSPYKVCDYADPSNSLFHQIAYLAGYSIADIIPGIPSTSTVQHCSIQKDEGTYRDLLDDLLFEHQLVLDDDGAGRITTKRWVADETTYIEEIGPDSLSSVQPLTWEKRYRKEDGVSLVWSTTEIIENALLYRDSLPVTAQGELTGKAIAAGDYYPPDSDISDQYQAFIDRWLDKPYLERKTRLQNSDLSLITTDNQEVLYSADNGINVISQNHEWHRSKIVFRNESGVTAKIYAFEITGRALIRKSIQTIVSPESATKTRLITTKYIFSSDSALILAQAVASDIAYSDFSFSFGLNRYIEPGTVIRMVNPKNSIDIRVKIMTCDFDIGRPVYSYTGIAVSDNEPATHALNQSYQTVTWPLIGQMSKEVLNNAPPSNNITNLQLSSSANPNGTIDIHASWEYVQGLSKADGFIFYAKRDIATPAEIDLNNTPNVFIRASSATAYSTTINLPTRQAGAGTLPIHYRFGVVAIGNRRIGTVPHLNGIVEDTAWIDKTFASKIQFDSENYWDLANGEFRVGTTTNFLRVKPSEGVVEFSGLDLELTESDLKTFAGSGATERSFSHEQLGLFWRLLTEVIGGLYYNSSNSYIYLHAGPSIGTVDLAMNLTGNTIFLRTGGVQRLVINNNGVSAPIIDAVLLKQDGMRVPNIFVQSSTPATAQDGDIWFKVS